MRRLISGKSFIHSDLFSLFPSMKVEQKLQRRRQMQFKKIFSNDLFFLTKHPKHFSNHMFDDLSSWIEWFSFGFGSLIVLLGRYHKVMRENPSQKKRDTTSIVSAVCFALDFDSNVCHIVIVYAHLRDREKHGSESITDPQCIIDLLWITSSSFHKKLSSSLTYDITVVHLVTRHFGPLPFLL